MATVVGDRELHGQAVVSSLVGCTLVALPTSTASPGCAPNPPPCARPSPHRRPSTRRLLFRYRSSIPVQLETGPTAHGM